MGRHPIAPRVEVWIVRFEKKVYHFLEKEEAHAIAARLGAGRAQVESVMASQRQLWDWRLIDELPPGYAQRTRKISSRARKPHPPVCPSCGAHWYGPGRPRKDGSRNVPPPIDPAEYDGPNPSSLRPRASLQAPAPDLADRPDLAGLLDPRLHEELPDDW
jgi:hypothetical protein